MGEVSARLLDARPDSATGVADQLGYLEAVVYVTLVGVDEHALRIARVAESLSLPAEAIRAELLSSDVLSRRGQAAQALDLQVALLDRATAAGLESVAARACLYLASTADRLGMRTECLRWAGAAQLTAADAPPSWRAEALMVLALFTVSHVGFDRSLVEHTLEEVRGVANPVLATVTLANLAEVATECDDLVLARRLVEEALDLLARHPAAAAALTWESIAQVEMASGDLDAADRALGRAFELGTRLGWCDVNGDPYLTLAELRLAQGRGEAALRALARPGRTSSAQRSSWVTTRELVVRAKILASLERWREAYDAMVDHLAAYERVRSIAAERVAVESQSTQTAAEERRRASKFEQLAMRDSLTGLYNRRYVDERLAVLTARVAEGPTERRPGVLSVAIVDVDHFKRVNDTYSHDVGDLVLARLGALLADSVDRPAPERAGEGAGPAFAARLGGEEFVLVFPDADHAAGVAACERLLERLRGESFEDLAPGLTVRASIGLVTLAVPSDPAELLRTADSCLYQAKRGGRDRLVATCEPVGVRGERPARALA